MKNIMLKSLYVIGLTILLLGIPLSGRFVANSFDLSRLDPDGSFLWISIHHITQAIVALIIIFVITRFKTLDFGFSLGNKEAGIKGLKAFMLFFSLYVLGAYLSTIFTGFQPFQFPLTSRNIIGYLGFQLLLSGPSEEIIFRALSITLFSLIINKTVWKDRISITNIYAAVIFGLAHVYIGFDPFQLSYSLFQVIYAMVLGYFYGMVYIKSKSVIYPMLMHSFSNVLMVGVTIILSFIL